jgi:hypothetical protein
VTESFFIAMPKSSRVFHKSLRVEFKFYDVPLCVFRTQSEQVEWRHQSDTSELRCKRGRTERKVERIVKLAIPESLRESC